MRDYANFVVLGALCVLGCASGETPASTQNGAMTGAGTTAPVTPSQPAAVSGAGAGPSAATTAPAASGGTLATGTAGAPTATLPTVAGTSGSGAAGTATTTASAGTSAGSVAGTTAAGAGGTSAAAGSGGSGGAMDPTFQNVYINILINSCPSCHMTGGVIGSPDLSSMEVAYSSLVGKDATTAMTGVCGGKGKLVTPGDCDKSLLFNKLSQATPICGRRMPLSSMTVSQPNLELLCAWIKAGAKNN